MCSRDMKHFQDSPSNNSLPTILIFYGYNPEGKLLSQVLRLSEIPAKWVLNNWGSEAACWPEIPLGYDRHTSLVLNLQVSWGEGDYLLQQLVLLYFSFFVIVLFLSQISVMEKNTSFQLSRKLPNLDYAVKKARLIHTFPFSAHI